MGIRTEAEYVESWNGPRGVGRVQAYEGSIRHDHHRLRRVLGACHLHRLRDRLLGEARILNTLVWDSGEVPNTVVTVGKNLVLDRLFGSNGPPNVATCVGVGNSATASNVTDTLLLGTSTLIKQTAASTDVTRSGQTETVKITFSTAEANFSWQEVVMMNSTVNATTASTMFNRIAPIGPFNKTTATSIVVTMSVSQA